MTLNIYTIRDSKVLAYATPFFMPTNGAALRAFSDHVNDPSTPVNKHPEDYELWHLGSFDDQDGTVTAAKPTRLGVATEYAKKE